MNKKDTKEMTTKKQFPSPTGVNYYELLYQNLMKDKWKMSWFPSPTGVNYYELTPERFARIVTTAFPSPTGVNYYE